MKKRHLNLTHYFNTSQGFGDYKHLAIDLLSRIINHLPTHCLISGTLLGYVRHRDFIPWDDDIDLLVPELPQSSPPNITLIYRPEHGIAKFCFTDQPEIQGDKHGWKKYIITPDGKYTWPFVDLFLYTINPFTFFNKEWDANQFFPLKTVSFLDIQVNIPKNPNYFLEKNYGSNYMTTFKSSQYSHKIDGPQAYATINRNDYEKSKQGC